MASKFSIERYCSSNKQNRLFFGNFSEQNTEQNSCNQHG